jgi:hypothetical protein
MRRKNLDHEPLRMDHTRALRYFYHWITRLVFSTRRASPQEDRQTPLTRRS